MTLDFADLADGVRRNNVGVGAIQVQFEARFDGERVIATRTDQSFRLVGGAGEPPPAGWTRFAVSDWDEPERTALRVVR